MNNKRETPYTVALSLIILPIKIQSGDTTQRQTPNIIPLVNFGLNRS